MVKFLEFLKFFAICCIVVPPVKGGTEANPSIVYVAERFSHDVRYAPSRLCVGILVSYTDVVVAARCLQNYTSDELHVDTYYNYEPIRVDNVLKTQNKGVKNYGVAVLKLRTPIKSNGPSKPAELCEQIAYGKDAGELIQTVIVEREGYSDSEHKPVELMPLSNRGDRINARLPLNTSFYLGDPVFINNKLCGISIASISNTKRDNLTAFANVLKVKKFIQDAIAKP